MQVELEAVRPGEGEGSEEELRLSMALLPLRLRIDQAVVDFCQVCLSITTPGRRTPHPSFQISTDAHTRVQFLLSTCGAWDSLIGKIWQDGFSSDLFTTVMGGQEASGSCSDCCNMAAGVLCASQAG